MRYAVMALVLVGLGAASASAQSERWANKMFAKSGTTHDFGNQPRGAVLHHRFVMSNIYAVPLTITAVRTSCGCVTVTPSAKVLQPRQEINVDVTMDTRRFSGPKTVSVLLTVGPQFTSTATLEVTGNSRADVVFNPGEVNFNLRQRGQTPTEVIEVEYAGVLDWRILEVATNQAPVDVKTEEMYRKPGRIGYRLSVTLKPDAQPGTHKHDIHLKTNDPASPLVPVLVEFSIQAALQVEPGLLSFGAVRVGESSARRVVVTGSKPFRILAIEGLGEGLTAEVPPNADKIQIVTFKCQPTQPGELRRQIVFKTDLDNDVTSLMIEAQIQP